MKFDYNIITSGSKGNAIIYHKEIMIDCGVSFARIKPYLKELKTILLTHQHGDHIHIGTLQLIQRERPLISVIAPHYLKDILIGVGIRNCYFIETNKKYDIGDYILAAVKLYHNVENVGYRLVRKKDNFRLFHATDTYTLEGIKALNYDAYFVEHNYKENDIGDHILEKKAEGLYVYEDESIENHLSFEKAKEWLAQNKGDKTKVIEMLHVSEKYIGAF